MADDVIVGVILQCLIVVENVHRPIAGLATAVEVRPHLLVKHEIPHQHGLAPLIDSAQSHIPHVGHKTLA